MDRASQIDDLTGSSLAHRTKRSDAALLRTLVMLLGIGWSLAFVVVGCGFDLQMYGDGSIFSYAIAAEQAWAFHWHNISGRAFVYLLAHWPAETYVRFSGDAHGGVVLHGLLFFCTPLVGLCATWSADQSEGRSLFLHACASTAVICPLVFGFPTEMWVAHAVFWPMLALARSADWSLTRTALFAAGLTALMLSHGGGVLLAGVIVASALLPGPRQPSRPRMLIGGGIAVFVWAAVLLAFRPDPYIAKVINTAAFSFVDLRNLIDPVIGTMIAAIIGYMLAAWLCDRILRLHSPSIAALFSVLWALAIYYRYFDASLLADARYPLRTALLVLPPFFATSALLGIRQVGRAHPLVARLGTLRQKIWPGHLAAVLVLITAVHVVETAKFVRVWSDYKTALAALATAKDAGPESPAARFASSALISDGLNRVAWSSTTHFLSILVAPRLIPARLVISPNPAYWWLSCQTATDSQRHSTAIPQASRAFIRAYACSH